MKPCMSQVWRYIFFRLSGVPFASPSLRPSPSALLGPNDGEVKGTDHERGRSHHVPLSIFTDLLSLLLSLIRGLATCPVSDFVDYSSFRRPLCSLQGIFFCAVS